MKEEKKEVQVPVKQTKQGSSMVIVVCVAAFFLAFALAMVYTAGLLLSRANRRLEQERSYQLAQSFARVLDEELKRYDSTSSAPADSFYRYVYQFLEGMYGEYDPEHPDETVFHYTAANPAGLPQDYGSVQVALYKEIKTDAEETMSGTLPGNANPTAVLADGLLRYSFMVEVTARRNNDSFCYRTEYHQKAVYAVTFRHKGRVIAWNETDQKWHQTSVDGPEYTDWTGEEITYEYDPTSIQECFFENAYPPAQTISGKGGSRNA